ncbi:MAG: ATP-dependent DNA ligase, partial [Betaproteobacteria bacterium]
MREFARLYAQLDASTSTQAKVRALQAHLACAAPQDAAWTVYLLSGGKPRQTVPTGVLREAACEAAGVPPWLFEECYQVVGDLAETMAHVLPAQCVANAEGSSLRAQDGLAAWMEKGLLPLRGLEPDVQKQRLRDLWTVLDTPERYLLTKLVGGGFRVGVSKL